MNQRKTPPKAWKPGQSGNPGGKKPGTRHKATDMLLKVMEGGAKEIVEEVVKAAKGGNLMAARIVLERLVPPAKERPISAAIALPDTATAEGIAQAQAAILQAVAAGQLLPGEGTALANIVEARRRAVETEELEARITALEGKTDGKT